MHQLLDQASTASDFDQKHFYLSLIEYTLKTRQSHYLANHYQRSNWETVNYASPTCVFLAGGKGVGKSTLAKITPEIFAGLDKVSKNNVLPFTKNYKGKEEGNNIIDLSLPYLYKNRSFYIETSLTQDQSFYQQFLHLLSSHQYKLHLYFIDTYDVEKIYLRSVHHKQALDSNKLYNEIEKNHDQVFQFMKQADVHLIIDNTEKFEIIQSKCQEHKFN